LLEIVFIDVRRVPDEILLWKRRGSAWIETREWKRRSTF